MLSDDDRIYYMRRQAQEERAVEAAVGCARQPHALLALLYAEMLGDGEQDRGDQKRYR